MIVLWLAMFPAAGRASGPTAAEEPLTARVQEPQDLWYVVEMLGQRAGYMHMETRAAEHQGRPAWRTVTDLRNEISRVNAGRTETLRITSRTDWLEDAEGRTLRVENVLDQGGGKHRTVLTVAGEGASLQVFTEAGERRFRVGWDEAAAGPGRSEQAVEDILSGRKTLARFKSFSFEAGNRMLDVTVRLLERLPDGGAVLEQEIGGLGLTTRETYDAEGVLVHQQVGPLAYRLASRDEALAPVEQNLAAFSQWTVALDRNLARPRSLGRGTYRLRPRESSESAAELSLERLFVQDRRQRIQDGALEVSAAGFGTDPKESFEPFLVGSTLIESDDPEIRDLARSLAREVAVEGAPPEPGRLAHRLERWVHENVRYQGSGIGLASARRTLKSRDGDCTENAFLLAALLRASKIPARVVVGLAYAGAEPAFIPHAWVEAWITNPQETLGEDPTAGWRALDSALYRAPVAEGEPPEVDAAHLAMAKTAGSEEGALLEISAPILNGLGRFDLEWVEEESEAETGG